VVQVRSTRPGLYPLQLVPISTAQLRLTSGSVSLLAGVAAALLLESDRALLTVDEAVRLNITAFDQHGNIATHEQGTVTLALTGFAVGGGTVTLRDGKASRVVRNPKAERVSAVLLLNGTIADVSVPASLGIDFLPGSPRRVLLPQVGPATVDALVVIPIHVVDQYNNINENDDRTLSLRVLGEWNQTLPVQIVSGRGEAQLNVTRPQVVQVQVEPSSSHTLDLTSALQNFAVSSGMPLASAWQIECF
jgi:hypothetical protein